MTSAFRYPDDVPELEDGVVVLRAVTDADLTAILEQCRDEQMVRWTQIPSPYGHTDAASFLEAVRREFVTGTSFTWAIDDGSGYAGNVQLRFSGSGEAELGFALHPAARGRGLMRRAVVLAAAYGFDIAGVEALLWTAAAGNWASRRVAWACGFTFHGRLRQAWSNGRWRTDKVVATLLPTDVRAPTLPWLSVPTLVGPTAVLRAQEDDDAPRMAEACRDERSRRWLGDLPDDYDEVEAMRHIEACRERHAEGSWLTWAITEPSSGLLVGEVSLMGRPLATAHEAEVGYWTHPAARGRGVMTEAVGLLLAWAFGPTSGLDLARVSLQAAEGNLASQQVAVRNGFRPVGVRRRAEHLRTGEVVDLLEYDVLPGELTGS